jgi:hypothetical protein
MAVPKNPDIAPPPNADDPEQSRRFIDMAREVEADESPDALDRAFDKVFKRGNRDSRPLSERDESER